MIPSIAQKHLKMFYSLYFMHTLLLLQRSAVDRKELLIVSAVTKKVISKFVSIILPSKNAPSETKDMVYNYATDLLTLSLIWHGYHDAIKERDGNRILLYWKFLLPIFQQEGRFNYAKEVFLLIS